MSRSVTIQDIAQALGLSRNTVSRALNNTGVIAPKTQERILSAARAMGYGLLPTLDEETSGSASGTATAQRNIAFVMRMAASESYFFSSIVNALEKTLSANGFTLTLVIVRPADFHAQSLPPQLKQADGIICADMFDRAYLSALFSTGLPIVLIESQSRMYPFQAPHTVIMMENTYNIMKLTGELLDRGHRRIAFMGNPEYCRGFFERHLGYTLAHAQRGIIPDKGLTIADYDATLTGDAAEYFAKMPKRPTAFICANDHYAISVIMALTRLGINIPEEAEVVGFDDLPQAEIISPALTTVHTFTGKLGNRAALAMIARIENPSLPGEAIYLPTEIRYRGSTKSNL